MAVRFRVGARCLFRTEVNTDSFLLDDKRGAYELMRILRKGGAGIRAFESRG